MWRGLVWIGWESGEQGGKINIYINDENNNSTNSSNNLKAVHSNIETRYKRSYNTRHIASYCSADKNWLDLPAATKPPQVENVPEFP